MANYRGLNIDDFMAHLQTEVQGPRNKSQGLYREEAGSGKCKPAMDGSVQLAQALDPTDHHPQF